MQRGLFLAAVLVLGLSLATPPSSAQPRAGCGDRWGTNLDDNIEPDQGDSPLHHSDEAFTLLCNAKLGWVRLVFRWNLIQPTAGSQIQWPASLSARTVRQIQRAGLKIYGTVLSPPAWASGGVPSYVVGHCLRPTGQGNVRFDPSKPECTRPPPLDPKAVRSFVTAIVRQFPEIRHWGFANEASNAVFWPPRAGDDPLRLLHLRDWLLAPAYEAVKAANPDALVVGPDENTPDGLRKLLELERAGGRRLFDVLSIHLYAAPARNYPVEAIRAFDEDFRSVLESPPYYYRAGRPLWVTETGYPREPDFDGLEEQRARVTTMAQALAYRGVEKVFFYRLGDCIGGPGYQAWGVLLTCPAPGGGVHDVPTPLYRDLLAFNRMPSLFPVCGDGFCGLGEDGRNCELDCSWSSVRPTSRSPSR